jgi:flavin reductase (DIM6/NTAB) family NADH-FMN oxidoreductase RutF
MIYNIKNLEKTDVYKLMSNLVIPRPIAWISSISKENIFNLAPFSYFTPLSSSPATMLISIGHKQNGQPKDTLKNLRETKKCSITIANTNQVKLLHKSAEALEYNKSEFSAFNIDKSFINENYPPIPSGSKVAFFCEYLQEVDLKGSKTVPVIVEVKEIFVDNSLITDAKKVKVSFSDAIARVGAKYFNFGSELDFL